MDSIQVDKLSPAERDAFMQQVQQEMAVSNAQELLTRISEKCFKKCVIKPSTSLDSTEQKCLALCMDRYMDSYNTVSKTYSERLHRELNRM